MFMTIDPANKNMFLLRSHKVMNIHITEKNKFFETFEELECELVVM